MATFRTRLLLVGATVLNGILAGGIVDRVIVGGPAWHDLGTGAWAEYSRYADLGNGLITYPVEAIGGALLIIAGTLSNYFAHNLSRAATISLYCAIVFSISGLMLTAKAAPIMLGLAASQPAAAIQHAFDEFLLWGLYLSGQHRRFGFVALTWALATLNR
jgi:hypothetical protein